MQRLLRLIDVNALPNMQGQALSIIVRITYYITIIKEGFYGRFNLYS